MASDKMATKTNRTSFGTVFHAPSGHEQILDTLNNNIFQACLALYGQTCSTLPCKTHKLQNPLPEFLVTFWEPGGSFFAFISSLLAVKSYPQSKQMNLSCVFL